LTAPNPIAEAPSSTAGTPGTSGGRPPKPRCVHLVPETYPAGAENQALALLHELRRRDELALELVCFEGGRSHQKFLELDIPVHVIGRRRRLSIDFPRRVRALRRIYSDEPPDILHTWLFEAHVVGLAAARRWTRTRVVMGARSGAVQRTMRGHQIAMRLLIKRADYAIANSAVGRDILLETGMPADRVTVTALGITDERLAVVHPPADVKAELGCGSGPLVVSLGRPHEDKDYPVLIAAMETVWQRHPNATLAFVGPSAEDIDDLGLDLPPGARATGWRDDSADYLNAADVVAVSSFTEGYSNAAAEGLLLGRPVVTTEAGDHPALVRETGGLVVPIRAPELLAGAILEMLEDPPDPERVMAMAKPRLTIAAVADVTERVYAEVLRNDAVSR
jgi:glycosyltransferase involved in cell wall biosynthesis